MGDNREPGRWTPEDKRRRRAMADLEQANRDIESAHGVIRFGANLFKFSLYAFLVLIGLAVIIIIYESLFGSEPWENDGSLKITSTMEEWRTAGYSDKKAVLANHIWHAVGEPEAAAARELNLDLQAVPFVQCLDGERFGDFVSLHHMLGNCWDEGVRSGLFDMVGWAKMLRNPGRDYPSFSNEEIVGWCRVQSYYKAQLQPTYTSPQEEFQPDDTIMIPSGEKVNIDETGYPSGMIANLVPLNGPATLTITNRLRYQGNIWYIVQVGADDRVLPAVNSAALERFIDTDAANALGNRQTQRREIIRDSFVQAFDARFGDGAWDRVDRSTVNDTCP